ncbi:hypothetical protein [Paenibacillus sp. VTT E-133291]|nr:hypothetical protein [Paenibacillus sp. VTT E-133291]
MDPNADPRLALLAPIWKNSRPAAFWVCISCTGAFGLRTTYCVGGTNAG